MYSRFARTSRSRPVRNLQFIRPTIRPIRLQYRSRLAAITRNRISGRYVPNVIHRIAQYARTPGPRTFNRFANRAVIRPTRTLRSRR